MFPGTFTMKWLAHVTLDMRDMRAKFLFSRSNSKIYGPEWQGKPNLLSLKLTISSLNASIQTTSLKKLGYPKNTSLSANLR